VSFQVCFPAILLGSPYSLSGIINQEAEKTIPKLFFMPQIQGRLMHGVQKHASDSEQTFPRSEFLASDLGLTFA
jgi:hypothetical protein